MSDITGFKNMNPKRYPLHHDHGTVTISRDVFETMSKELERLRPMETGLELAEADRDAYRKRVDDLEKAQRWLKVCEEKKQLERMSKNNVTHGMTNTGLYWSFKGMKSRCYRNKDIHYPAYGGRGITICKEWLDDPKSFYDWALANGWKEGLTIERIDVNGNYCPENCKWIPMSEQYKNKRTPYQIRRKQALPNPPEDRTR